jgi:tRNA 2-thiouridine synthesizing protein E
MHTDTTPTESAVQERLLARLDAIDAKLDYVVERQEYVEDLVREMTPVLREAMNAMAGEMQGWEERGWFAMGKEMVGLFDRLAAAYGPDDVREFSDHVVQIVDTVRNVTQPDVLDFANDATDVLHHADEMQPVGPLGMAKATADADVRRGMAVALQILKQLGQVSGSASDGTRRPAPTPSAKAKPASSKPAASAAARPAVATTPKPAADVLGEVVEWQGRRFSAEGYLLDVEAWDEALATAMAEGLGITLTDEHWTVLRWARQDYLEHGASPNVRRVATGSGAGTQRVYQLFPGTPGKHIAMVAGIPKPVGCV